MGLSSPASVAKPGMQQAPSEELMDTWMNTVVGSSDGTVCVACGRLSVAHVRTSSKVVMALTHEGTGGWRLRCVCVAVFSAARPFHVASAPAVECALVVIKAEANLGQEAEQMSSLLFRSRRLSVSLL